MPQINISCCLRLPQVRHQVVLHNAVEWDPVLSLGRPGIEHHRYEVSDPARHRPSPGYNVSCYLGRSSPYSFFFPALGIRQRELACQRRHEERLTAAGLSGQQENLAASGVVCAEGGQGAHRVSTCGTVAHHQKIPSECAGRSCATCPLPFDARPSATEPARVLTSSTSAFGIARGGTAAHLGPSFTKFPAL